MTEQTKPNEVKASQVKSNGTKPDEKTRDSKLPFSYAEVYGWLEEMIKRDYGTAIKISDFNKNAGMIDIEGQLLKK